jgi:hypothetical protein
LLWGPGLLSSTGWHLFSRRPDRVPLTYYYPGMAHKMQRRVLHAVFSVQRMRMVMPIFWDVTRRVRQVYGTKN